MFPILHIYILAEGSPVCTVGSSHNTHTKSMTLSDLNRIINIVHPVINNTHHHDNKYLITNYGETIYYRNDHNNIYHRFIDDVTLNRIPRPSTIWTSHSPCLACSRSLMLEYGKPETIKPTLRLATIDLGSSLLDTVNSLKCMAKLVHLNITILPWDWTEIRNNVHRAECIQSIDTAQRDLGFTYSQNEVRKIIEFINELSHNPQVSTWCELFSP